MEGSVPGTTNLQTLIDKRLLVVLRDGRNLFGILRSYDQFGNLMLEDTIERYYLDLEWADEALGIFLVRGENVVLIGDIDEEEFKAVTRRMAKWRRPLETLLPRYQANRTAEQAKRRAAIERGTSDQAPFDFY